MSDIEQPTREQGLQDPGLPAKPGPDANRRGPVLFVVAVSVALILVAVLLIPHFVSGSSNSDPQPQLATASIRSFLVTANTTGTVVPSSSTAVNFTTPGQLTQLDATVGEQVQPGTVLARLDGTQAQSGVAQAEAALQSADAALASAKAPLQPGQTAQLTSALQTAQSQYDQTVASVNTTNTQDAAVVAADQQTLASDRQRAAAAGCPGSGSASSQSCLAFQATINADQRQLQIDQAQQKTDAANGPTKIAQARAAVNAASAALSAASTPDPTAVATAQAGVTAAQARLQAAQATLAATVLTAPVAGTVLQVNGQIGQNVTGAPTSAPMLPGTTAPIPASATASGTSTSSGSEPLIVIGKNSSFVIAATFPSTQIHQVAAGQTGTITATTISGAQIPCRVLAVAQQSTLVAGQPVFYVTVVPEGPTTQLSDGMTVNVNINVTRATNVLAVPQSSIYLVSGAPHVDVWAGKRLVSTAVTTGVQGTTLVEITSGLSAGQQVVLSAYQGLPQSGTSAPGTP